MIPRLLVPLRVMIVDDHPLVRAAVGRAIEGDAFTVVAEASTAEQALVTAPTVAPDILLVDIALPGMSGLQLVRELAPRMPSTAIVVLTTSTADRDVADAIRHGARGYLTKDISPEALVRSLSATQSGELVIPRKLAARLIAKMSWRIGSEPAEETAGADQLTSRERDVLRLLADGLGDRDIAAALTISRRTAETHVSSILHKLGVKNRAEAARWYREGG
ncbi:MAG: response regulator transcription factor [Chloroflexota bacterium]